VTAPQEVVVRFRVGSAPPDEISKLNSKSRDIREQNSFACLVFLMKSEKGERSCWVEKKASYWHRQVPEGHPVSLSPIVHNTMDSLLFRWQNKLKTMLRLEIA
jgi:hypothetical protein